MQKKKREFKLCVATPIYNGSEYIRRIYDSIAEYETTWLIRDDGSTDDTLEIIKELSHESKVTIHYWSGYNEGLTYGRNFLCDKFVNLPYMQDFTHMIFLDVDDYFNPGWYDRIIMWINKVVNLYPDEKTPYLCFSYWNDRALRDECQIYTKLNTLHKVHPAVGQWENGGWDLMHVIPREYLIEVKEWDGNYYHVVKNEKWTSDVHNFMAYLGYKASFISDIVATIGSNGGEMSETYYHNVVTKYAKGQLDEMMMLFDIYGKDRMGIEFDWHRIPAHRWLWYLNCVLRMIKVGTLVFSDKQWDNYMTPNNVTPSKSYVESKLEY